MRAWIVLLVLPAACLRNTSFKCDTSDQCGTGGVCQPSTHYCSFPDSTCGQKYGPQAGDLAGTCVGGGGGDAGVDAPGSGSDAPGDAAVMCPPGYTTLTGAPPSRKYKLIANATDWVSQRAACSGSHTFLAAPGSPAELAAMDTLDQAQNGYWIGVDDLQTPGMWVTVNNTTQSYLPWAPSFPTSNPNDQCVEVDTQNAQFQNVRCTGGLPAICECE